CGNGLLEAGEECDCGELPNNICSPVCCNVETCKLKNGSMCATGGCCHLRACKIKSNGSLCRSPQNECDLQDLCDGQRAACLDAFKKNGHMC
ncbi:hypothetical protein HELRODRAFT_137676, partial [Helobdella robusta]|uniref:Disintegrin domain-containing protein n=1 Tax=Helobdella robusta TaxID=6412 RepID=T1EIM5_HELRO